ncbi:MAG: hypothetical protein HLUCCA08_12450 [Rhodobacteraceae bacterium HLUCCA08]|nr:MAG: hypothetical protein HLUCCA08_12450 [Rhodobacteraceae bacterium HLUCCA08]
MRPLALALCLAPGPVAAGAEGLDLSPADRAAFGAEIRALLLDEPELVRPIGGAVLPADPVPTPGYDDEIAADLELIAAHATALFGPDGAIRLGAADGPVAFASFAAPGSDTAAMLDDYARSRGIAIALRDPATHGALMEALGLDTVPSHVFADLMVRGDVPPIVLDRYLP